MQVHFKASPYKPLLPDERNTKIDMKRERCKCSISSVAKAGKTNGALLNVIQVCYF